MPKIAETVEPLDADVLAVAMWLHETVREALELRMETNRNSTPWPSLNRSKQIQYRFVAKRLLTDPPPQLK